MNAWPQFPWILISNKLVLWNKGMSSQLLAIHFLQPQVETSCEHNRHLIIDMAVSDSSCLFKRILQLRMNSRVNQTSAGNETMS